MGSPAEKLFEEASRLTSRERGTRRFLEVLEQAVELPESERRACATSSERLEPPTRGGPVLGVAETRAGVVHLGGDAVEDCDRLYDG